MKFGIAPLTLELIMGIILQKKGLDGLKDFKFSNIIRRVAEAGYRHCELTLDIFQIFPITVSNEEIAQLIEIKKEYNMTYSAHFPLLSIDLACPNQFTRQGSINATINSYELFKGLEKEIDLYVIHPTGEVVSDILQFMGQYPDIGSLALDLFANYSIQSIKDIMNISKIDREKLVVENVIFPFAPTIDIINELNVGLCLDTAHILGGFSGEVDLIETTTKYLNITKEIHLQDYSANYVREHSPLGTGSNFPSKFLKIIHDQGFKGPIVFELFNDEAIASINYIKEHAPEIDVPNAKNISFSPP